jgi:malic enzyme
MSILKTLAEAAISAPTSVDMASAPRVAHSRPSTKLDVLVIGAGPAGLAVGHDLRSAEVHFLLVERSGLAAARRPQTQSTARAATRSLRTSASPSPGSKRAEITA